MAIKKSNSKANAKSEPTYKVLEECGTLSTSSTGWEKKLRFISWNGDDPKYDIRAWKETEDGEKCGKGITFTGDELEALMHILNKIAEEE